MTHVIKKALVAAAFGSLRTHRVHDHFPGYLHLVAQAAKQGRNNNLEPDFKAFYREFFTVPGGPNGFPYLKPFTAKKPSRASLWQNDNLAGSYAPSSLRGTTPLRKAIKVTAATGEYSLKDGHANMAFEHLFFSQPLPAIDLAIFLYRDASFVSGDLTIQDLVNTFAFEFGYSATLGSEKNPDFAVLYSVDDDRMKDHAWLEPL
jgi:hypothetical protein